MKITVKSLNPYRGLMFRRKPKIPVCFPSKGAKSLHTLFVFFRVDVMCLNEEGRVIGAIYRMRPFSIYPIPRNTSTIVEHTSLPFRIGDDIELEVV